MADLIAAIATAPAPSAIGILRLSGEGAVDCADRIFKARYGAPLALRRDREMVFGSALDARGRPLDEGLAFLSRAPGSYTGEDTAELQLHGAPTVLAMALEAAFAAGARQALPGEFTKRAFLNGKLDLLQAEAVIDLIDAETPAAVYSARSRLAGALSRRVDRIYDGLTDLLAHFDAVLDYPDEDIDPFRAQTIRTALDEAAERLDALLDTYHRGRRLNSGVATAIVGRPNVGKSSLLNALAGYERAIVTQIPGTTRDTVEEKAVLGGVLLRLTDTAGIRETGDEVEQLGVARSRRALEEADLVLAVVDGSQPLTEEDETVLALAGGAARCICVVNKDDLPQKADRAALAARFTHVCAISAREGVGLERLGELTAELFPEGTGSAGLEELLANTRQYSAALRAQEAVRRARENFEAGFPPDAVLTDAEEALAALGELTGRTVREDVTDRIFSRFCVGK